MLERPAVKELTKAQAKWLALAASRPIKRADFRRSNMAIYFLAKRGFLQLVKGPRGSRGDIWHITDAGRAMRPTPAAPHREDCVEPFCKGRPLFPD